MSDPKTTKTTDSRALHSAEELYHMLLKKPGDVFINAKQAVAIFRLFREQTLLESVVDTPDHRAFLQAALMSAIEGSAAMGFIEGLFRSAYKPNATIKGIILALGKAAYRHYYQRPPTDLKDLKLYARVLEDISNSHRPYFDMISQGVED